MRSLRQITGNNSVQFFNSLISFMSEFGFVADKTAQEAYDEMVSGATNAKITVNFVWNNDYTIQIQSAAKNASGSTPDNIIIYHSATNLPHTAIMASGSGISIGENSSINKPTVDGYRHLNAYVVKNGNAWFIQFGGINTTVPDYLTPEKKPILCSINNTVIGFLYSRNAFTDGSEINFMLKNGTNANITRFYQYRRSNMCDYSEYVPYFVGGNYTGALKGVINTSYTSLGTYYELENGKNFFEVTAGLAIVDV